VIDAIQALRTLNRTSARKVPADAPIGFVRKRWQPLVFVDGGIDRKFYELCAVAELKNSLRAGDVSVAGSRQFKDFDAYLMSRSTFDGQRETGTLAVPVADTPQAYLTERLERLRTALDEVNRLAEADQLPDAVLKADGLKISPLDADVPEAAEALRERAYAILPHIKITDLLLEVDRWTNFSQHFNHLKTGEAPTDGALLLTAVLGDALNPRNYQDGRGLSGYQHGEAVLARGVARPGRDVQQSARRTGQLPSPDAVRHLLGRATRRCAGVCRSG
jgi:hypothetical protein